MRAIFSDKATNPVACIAAVVYFIQGAIGLSSIAVALHFRSLGWTIGQITSVSSIVSLPWVLKIFYGFISDRFPLWGLRRKPYLILCSLLSSLGWLIFALKPEDHTVIMVSLTLANLGFAATDVITDGFVADHSTPLTSSIFQSVAWGFRSFGAILSGFLGGYLAAHFSYTFVFFLTAVLPLLALGVVIPLRETPFVYLSEASAWASVKKCFKLLASFPVRWFLLVLLWVPVSAVISAPFFFHMKEVLKFQETFLGTLTSIGWTGAMVGSYLCGKYLKNIRPAPLLFGIMILNAVNILSTLWIRDLWSAAILVFLGGVLTYLTLLPLMSMSAVLAHGTGVEGTFFAVLMSAHNLGQIGFQYLGGRISGFLDLKALIWGTTGVALLGLLIVPKLAPGMRLNAQNEG